MDWVEEEGRVEVREEGREGRGRIRDLGLWSRKRVVRLWRIVVDWGGVGDKWGDSFRRVWSWRECWGRVGDFLLRIVMN